VVVIVVSLQKGMCSHCLLCRSMNRRAFSLVFFYKSALTPWVPITLELTAGLKGGLPSSFRMPFFFAAGSLLSSWLLGQTTARTVFRL
jgi:hypothetical protein